MCNGYVTIFFIHGVFCMEISFDVVIDGCSFEKLCQLI